HTTFVQSVRCLSFSQTVRYHLVMIYRIKNATTVRLSSLKKDKIFHLKPSLVLKEIKYQILTYTSLVFINQKHITILRNSLVRIMYTVQERLVQWQRKLPLVMSKAT